METRTVEQVENWSTRRFSDGYAGLRELSDGEFSGAVRAGGAWLFMLNGRVIGIHEGSLDDFEDADGKAYAAPHPSLPLLFNMKEEGGETQAKYYTNDTPLSEADSTLSQGGFTGYVELSENVLSGDYYVVYYGGRSMSVAFVGASEQVVSGDEAFERAADEVGIYEVKDVDIDVIDLPEPEEPDDSDESESATGTGTGSGTGTGTGTAAASDRSNAGSDPDPSGASPDPSHEPTDSPRQGTATDSPAGTGTAATGRTARSPETDATEGSSTPDATDPSPADTEPAATDARASVGRAGPATETEPASESDERASDASSRAADPTPDAPEVETESPDAPDRSPDASDRSESASEQTTDDEGMFGEEEQWRETTTIPSLDPDRTEGRDDAKATAQAAAQTRKPSNAASGESRARRSKSSAASASGTASTSGEGSASGGSTASESSGRSGRGNATGTGSAAGGSSADEANARVEELRSRLRQREQQVERLENSLSTVRSERNELKRERDALRQEVERLEAELESAESGGAASGADRRLDRAGAFDGTNLFVRYRSKGEATLKEAAAGDADAEDVNANLQLEHHTQFEADDAAVDGRPFEEFLGDSFEYRFVSWLVEELLYEIRDTGHRNGLRELYDAIPRIDRVDLHGSVSAGTDEEDTRQESFDVIARDRMGNPLVVADLNGSRDPTTGEMMGTHVDAATGVAEAHDELAGAFQVTESFFEPEALETAESATSGGLLSREKRESFVKLSRKRGYHLCLVESRSGGFHLNVPEL